MAPDSLQVTQEGSRRCNITWNVPQSSHYIARHLEFEVRTRSLDRSWEVSTGPSPACPDSCAAHPVRPPPPQRHDSPRQPCGSSVLPAPASPRPPAPCSLPVTPHNPGAPAWQTPAGPREDLHSQETRRLPSVRFQRPWDAPSPLFQSSVGPGHRGLCSFIPSLLYSLTQSLSKHFLNAYYVLDAGKRVGARWQASRSQETHMYVCVCGGGSREAGSQQTWKQKTVEY